MAKNYIIGISGKIGSGKNTVSELIQKHSSVKFEETAFAKKLKQIVAMLAAVPYETTLTQEGKNIVIKEYNRSIGQMLQDVGTNAMRDHFDKNVWINACLLEIKNNPGNYTITDCRFKNEAQELKNTGAILIRVNRKNNPIALNSGRDLNHPSETDLDDYTGFDYVVTNDGSLEDLEQQVIRILTELGI